MNEKKSESESEIQPRTRSKHLAEDKIAIVLVGLRGEESISAICKRESIAPNLYYHWRKNFLEAGKKRFSGDTLREVNSIEVNGLLRQENSQRPADHERISTPYQRC